MNGGNADGSPVINPSVNQFQHTIQRFIDISNPFNSIHPAVTDFQNGFQV